VESVGAVTEGDMLSDTSSMLETNTMFSGMTGKTGSTVYIQALEAQLFDEQKKREKLEQEILEIKKMLEN
jgi:hypothetical protein